MANVMKLSKNHSALRVLIAGAGIGGLTLAQALLSQGLKVIVCEKDEAADLRPQGYRIHINPEGGQALSACLPESRFSRFVATTGKPARKGPAFLNQLLEDRSGQISLMPAIAAPSSPQPHRAVDRLLLRNLLLEGLSVRFGQALMGFGETESGQIQVELSDGTVELVDLVVGADGVGSRAREWIYPSAKVADTGWQGTYGKSYINAANRELLEPFVERAFTIVNGPDNVSLFLAGFQSSAEEYLMWVLVLPPNRHGSPDLLAEARAQLKDWHPNLRSAVDQSDPQTVSKVAFRETVELGPRTGPRQATLLGDSLHAMLPAGGEGGSNALQDAAELAGLLSKARDGQITIPQAIETYETSAIARGTTAIARSRKLGHSLFGFS